MDNTYKEHYNPMYDDTPVVCSPEEANKADAQTAQRQLYQAPAYAGQGQAQGQYGDANPQDMPIAVGSARTCGLKRKTLYIIVASVILLAAAIGAAAAAGVLASQKNKAEKKLVEISGSPASSETNSGNSTSPTAQVGALASFTVQSQWGGYEESCPGSDGSTYEVPGTNLKFRRECNANYPGADLCKVPMSTMEDCINFCAIMYMFPQSANGRCLIVSWITKDLQGTEDNWCWLKYEKLSGTAVPKAEAAYLVNDDGEFVGNKERHGRG